jgi:hypothetical protein
MVRPNKDEPEARLKAAPQDQRVGKDVPDLLRDTDDQIQRRENAEGLDDSQPQARLEAVPADRRNGQGPEDLLKAPDPADDDART